MPEDEYADLAAEPDDLPDGDVGDDDPGNEDEAICEVAAE